MRIRHPQQLTISPHVFLHAGLMHLAGNMLFLIVFGTRVNSIIGNIPTLILYPLLGAIAGWAHMQSVTGGPAIPMVGASGAIMGMCGMYLVLFPLQRVHMVAWWRWGLFRGFHLSHKVFALPGLAVVGAYIAFDVAFVLARIESSTAHWAHLGGFLAGMAAATALLAARQVAPGANLFSVVLGKYAWPLVGKPAPLRVDV